MAHPVSKITQPRTHAAFTGRRYGSFASKGVVGPDASNCRLVLAGGYRFVRYGGYRLVRPPD